MQLLSLLGKKTNSFTPSDIANLALWLRAETAGVTESSGFITNLTDFSASPATAQQANSSQRPSLISARQNNRPGIYFDCDSGTTGDSIIVSDTTKIQSIWDEAGYLAFVYTHKGYGTGGGSDDSGMLFDKGGWSIFHYAYAGTTFKLAFRQKTSSGATVIDWSTNNTFSKDTCYLVEAFYSRYNSYNQPVILINGVYQEVTKTTSGTGTILNDNGTNLGIMGLSTNSQSSCTEADLYEFLLYSSLPSTRQRDLLRRYLASKWGISITYPEPAKIVLLCGQSNAVGLGTISAAPAYLQGVITNAKIWRNDTTQWQNLEAGVNNDGATGAEFGPELSLAHSLATSLNEPIYLIKYAVSGTSMAVNWLVDSGVQYYQYFFRARAAAIELLKAGKDPEIIGYAFMQGESDADNSGEAAAYESHLTNFINTWRKVIGEANLNSAPFIIGQIGNITTGSFPYRDDVQTAQSNVATALSDTALITTSDLALLGDNVHFGTDASITLGERFSAAILENQP